MFYQHHFSAESSKESIPECIEAVKKLHQPQMRRRSKAIKEQNILRIQQRYGSKKYSKKEQMRYLSITKTEKNDETYIFFIYVLS